MDHVVIQEERPYWIAEEHSRAIAFDAATARGDAPHLLPGAEIRLREARERLAAMRMPAVTRGRG